MSKQGEIGGQLLKWKDIQQKLSDCTDIMKINELKKAETNCKRTLGTMIKSWNGDLSEISVAQHG